VAPWRLTDRSNLWALCRPCWRSVLHARNLIW